LSNIYLVRHGQAGTRDAYDRLSDLGREQARLLGEYFAEQRLRFSAAFAGSMQRQQQTAAEVRKVYEEKGIQFPEIVTRREWDEFNLDQIYRELAPRMCDDDPDFRNQYEAMRQQVRESGGKQNSAVHRRWLPCDSQIVHAWIAGKYPYLGESWKAFLDRVAAARSEIRNGGDRSDIVVFTSAMPVAIWTGMALDIADGRIMRLAGVLHNTSYSILRLRADDLRLLTFNAAPHLLEDHLRTRR
jgi:broad specificity phosphatase PhoE